MSALNDPKLAVVTGVTTSASGLNTMLGLEWIPDSVGKLATCVGIVLSCIMIRYWLQKMKIERREAKQRKELHDLEVKSLLLDIQQKREETKKEAD